MAHQQGRIAALNMLGKRIMYDACRSSGRAFGTRYEYLGHAEEDDYRLLGSLTNALSLLPAGHDCGSVFSRHVYAHRALVHEMQQP